MANYKLSEIVDEYLEERGLPDNNWLRCWTNGVSCLRDVGMDISSIPKSVELLVDSAQEVSLPSDFLNYISINVVGQDGYLWGLGKNNSINATNYYNQCGEPTRNRLPKPTGGVFQGQISNPTYLANHWRNGENTGAYFNAGGHNVTGQYKIDYNTNKIILSRLRFGSVIDADGNSSASKIILEYIADINSDDMDYQIHPFLVESVKAWIEWKILQRDRNISGGEKQMANEYYLRERRKAVHRFNSMTMQEMLDSMRKNNSGTAKW
jgi:hypothetical protein